MPDGYAGRTPFPPIAQYAFLSDCEVFALVAPTGNVEWLCTPRPDSPSVFGSILDRAAGGFRLSPTEATVPAGRRYLPGTLVLETTWQTRTGWLIVRDALCIGEWYHEERRAPTFRRSPADTESRRCLLRTVRCVSGMVEIQMRCDPVFDDGRVNGTWEYTSAGYGSARVTARDEDPPLCINTNLRLGFDGRAAHARTRLSEGDDVFVALCWSDKEPPAEWAEASDWMWRTGESWRLWLNHGAFPDHPWRTDLQRSALTLKGLSYQPTGALVAAATTSLPETPGGERNWDYRYSWIRDSTFALWGLYTLGFEAEADDFFSFVADVCEDADLQVLYGVDGERELPERILDHLTGYEGAQPVRVGNDAYCQDQHDIWGAFLDSVYLHARSRDHLPERVWPLVSRQVAKAIEHWPEPDRGIWEVRGELQHFTSSKLMCWVACDRGARLARLRDQPELAEEWSKVAAEIHADICEKGIDERGVFTQAYGTTALDASVLLMPLVRFLPADDPRIRATVVAIADELTVDGLVLRYRTDQTDDGLAGEEGTFTICSFWLVSALSEIGEHERARALCERLLGFASPLGLYAEELDPRTGRHLGNFPQAFTHLALINAVMHVIYADQNQESRFAPARSLTG
ncbi:MAG: glycoside hydrolase family 15 protein [Acidimicrobiales bacterium]